MLRLSIASAAFVALLLPHPGAAQTASDLPAAVQRQIEVTGKRVLDHSDYAGWRTLQSRAISRDGEWLTFRYVPGEGDAELVLRAFDGSSEVTVPRGQAARFLPSGAWAVFEISPMDAAVRQAERDDTPRDDMPMDSLGIVRLDGSGEVMRYDRVTSVRFPAESGNVVAFQRRASDDEEPEAEGAAAEEASAESDDAEEDRPDRGEGHPLVVLNLETGEETRIDDVTDYRFTPDGDHLAYLTATEDGDGDGAWVLSIADGTSRALHAGTGRYRGLVTADEGDRVGFMTDAPDWDAETPRFSVMVADANDGMARAVAAPGAAGLIDGWGPSEHGSLQFSRTGRRIFFGAAPAPVEEVEDTLLDSDRVSVDVWNWKDPYLQPMQLVQLEDERERTWWAVSHLDDGDRVVQLATPELPDIQLGDEGEADFARGSTSMPYRQLVSWDGRYHDIHAVDVRTGESRLIAEMNRGSAGQISPAGRWISWWDQEATSWMAAPVEGGAPTNLSANIPHPTWDELDDHPQGLPPESGIQWTEGDEEAVVADRFDLWVVNPEDGGARSLTEGTGRAEGIQFRYARANPEERAIPRDEPVFLRAFHLTEKSSGLYRDRIEGSRPPERLVYGDRAWQSPVRAEDADRYLVASSTFQEYPEVQLTTDFRDFTPVSETNPQQAEFSWGSAQLYEWTSAEGERLQGILYTPENFDPTHEYPMMVYFYERMSDGLHNHRTPGPGGSSIDFPFYVSRGYLLFVPDIPYQIGWPGESAMNAVVPGVTSLIDEGFVDRERVGVQGHSWGGYQIAYMVTRTDIFAAAEAGAPVANMTSAYGGIRWASGMSRAFQYERTQSRIGGTLWDAQHRYIENSPLFFADKVETPVLMMHNDEDGAVPWYQGIEYFSALRRLGKPVWMLNYNGEAHGLRQRRNRKDWAIRMQQFFDHYLMDAPAPVWMEEGVPAILKGRTLGLELITPRRPISDDDGGS